MTLDFNFKPVVINKQNCDLYSYLGNNKFRNLRTDKEGVVADEIIPTVFELNLPASEMINEYPLISELISKLDLKYDILGL